MVAEFLRRFCSENGAISLRASGAAPGVWDLPIRSRNRSSGPSLAEIRGPTERGRNSAQVRALTFPKDAGFVGDPEFPTFRR